MKNTELHIDEFGTIRFSLFRENGWTYSFEQEADSELLFVTTYNEKGRTTEKQVINTHKHDNKEIVERYQDFLREQTE